MEKIFIYGAGEGGKHLLEEIKAARDPYEIIGFVDRNWGVLSMG